VGVIKKTNMNYTTDIGQHGVTRITREDKQYSSGWWTTTIKAYNTEGELVTELTLYMDGDRKPRIKTIKELV